MKKYKIIGILLMMLALASCSKDKLFTYPSSNSDKTDITSVRLLNEAGESVISSIDIDDDKTLITIVVKSGQSLNKLVPTATVSEGVIVQPIMGTYTDFSNNVVYTLIAGNRTTKRDWTFVVKP